MRFRPSIALPIVLLSCLLITVPAEAAPPQLCPPASVKPKPAQAAKQILCVVNAERAKRGLTPLRRSRSLARGARGHSRRMVRRKRFSHTAGGSTVRRVARTGYGRGVPSWWSGETLGYVPRGLGPARVVGAWLRSPGHRAVLLGRDWDHIGVGVRRGSAFRGRRGGFTITGLFGRR